MERRFLAAVAQIDTGHTWEENLSTAEQFVEQAVARGARLIVFPENFTCYEGSRTRVESLENSMTLLHMTRKAKEHNIWILCGTIFTPGEDGRHRNTSILLNPKGERVARYDKTHLFDVTLPDGEVRKESKLVQPGENIVTVNTELGYLGLSVCYDLRFPELYRQMTVQGAQILCVPAMFAAQTGRAHWEVLLRARAIENTCFVIAADQWGGKGDAYGHSMIINPWGEIIAEVKEGQGIALGEIDLDQLTAVRDKLPCLTHRRTDLY